MHSVLSARISGYTGRQRKDRRLAEGRPSENRGGSCRELWKEFRRSLSSEVLATCGLGDCHDAEQTLSRHCDAASAGSGRQISTTGKVKRLAAAIGALARVDHDSATSYCTDGRIDQALAQREGTLDLRGLTSLSDAADGEWVEANLLAPVPHRQYVFTIPRLLRPLFARRRALLGKLCSILERLFDRLCSSARPGARPGLVLFVQTFGDLVNYNPHIHVLAADGAFDAEGGFRVLPALPRKLLEASFRKAVLDLLCREGLVSEL
ncbi:MAG: transposase, partial [Alphaproteobacteria bacterium]|nr:transposase [Alphaproteobacteria bacterium]